MSTYRIRALALKKTKLGEADLIITFLAADGCQVRAVAKGMRKATSRFGARLEPFNVVDIVLARGRSLDVVTDAEVVARYDGLRGRYEAMAAASVVTDFLDKVSVECQAEDRLFALAATTLDVMDTAPEDRLPVLVAAFLAKGMAIHGYRPQLGSCTVCETGPCACSGFSLGAGGIVCPECAGSASALTPLSEGARELLATLLASTMSECAAHAVPPKALAEVMVMLRHFIAYHLPARLKALELYSASA